MRNAGAPGATADGANTRPACFVEGASRFLRCCSRGTAAESALTLWICLCPQRHKRAVLRQQPGLPDPLYAAKGRFPAGYPNPDDESVRACLICVARRSVALFPRAAACAAPISDDGVARRKGKHTQNAWQECAASTCNGLPRLLRLREGRERDGARRNASANANGPLAPLLAPPMRRRLHRHRMLRRRDGKDAPSSTPERSAV